MALPSRTLGRWTWTFSLENLESERRRTRLELDSGFRGGPWETICCICHSNNQEVFQTAKKTLCVLPWWAKNSEDRGIREAWSESPLSLLLTHFIPPASPESYFLFKERWWEGQRMTSPGNVFLPGKHMNTYMICVVLIINLIFHFAESNS